MHLMSALSVTTPKKKKEDKETEGTASRFESMGLWQIHAPNELDATAASMGWLR